METLLTLLQVDEAVELATHEWTIAGFAIFVWLVSCGVLIWMLRRKDAVIIDLAGQVKTISGEITEYLKQQVEDERENGKRLEAAMQTTANALHAAQEELQRTTKRLEDVERKLP